MLVVAIVLVAALALRPSAPPTMAEQATAVADELRCPDCAGLSAADSPTQAAAEIRRQVADMLATGMSAEQVKATFVARYGDWILLTPPGPASFLVPILVTAAGAVVLGWWLLGQRHRAPEPAVAEDPDAAGALLPLGGPSPTARRAATAVAVALVGLIAIGFLLPEPFSLVAETVVNQSLAEAQAAEAARQATIERLLAKVSSDPTDTESLSALADAYLAGTTADDLRGAAIALLAIIGQDAHDTDAYARLITAYIRAADWTDAAAATDALAGVTPDSVDVPFFRGLIAWRGHGDAATAIEAFDAFLAAAPDDPRAPMIRALRAEATGEVH